MTISTTWMIWMMIKSMRAVANTFIKILLTTTIKSVFLKPIFYTHPRNLQCTLAHDVM